MIQQLFKGKKRCAPVYMSVCVRVFVLTKWGKNSLKIGYCALSQLNAVAFRLVWEVNYISNKVIEEMCEKSTWHGWFSRPAASFRVIFSRKQRNLFQILSRGRCVHNFRSISFFVWSAGLVQKSQACIQLLNKLCTRHVNFGNFLGFWSYTLSV